MIVRPEQPADLEAIRYVNAAAFGQDAEARLVDEIRRGPDFIAALSLVADEGAPAGVVGHLMLSRIHVVDGSARTAVLALAPMAVRPDRQRRGIGSRLVREGLGAARDLGWGVAIVLGHPGFYPRFGFEPAAPRGIRCPWLVPEDVFMVAELVPGALARVRGEAVYPEAFMRLG
jgi:predicted N-acetyltransferase YhbS